MMETASAVISNSASGTLAITSLSAAKRSNR